MLNSTIRDNLEPAETVAIKKLSAVRWNSRVGQSSQQQMLAKQSVGGMLVCFACMIPWRADLALTCEVFETCSPKLDNAHKEFAQFIAVNASAATQSCFQRNEVCNIETANSSKGDSDFAKILSY